MLDIMSIEPEVHGIWANYCGGNYLFGNKIVKSQNQLYEIQCNFISGKLGAKHSKMLQLRDGANHFEFFGRTNVHQQFHK